MSSATRVHAHAPTRAREARSELERLTRRLLVKIKKEIRELAGRPSAAVRRYQENYLRHVRTYRAESSKNALVERVLRSDIVFCGDFHTLAPSQKTAIRILHDVVRERPRIVLALEMVRIESQAEVDRFLRGEASEESFLRSIDYYRTWDFDWSNYASLFAFAREAGIRILALNSAGTAGTLRARDRRAGEELARAYVAEPDALFFVLYGDFHIAPEHLPREFHRALPDEIPTPRRLLLYQNSEEIHFALSAGGRASAVDVVEIDDESFSVQSATPLVKWSSYLHWEQRHGSVHLDDHPDWEEPIEDGQHLIETFWAYAAIVAEYLGLELPKRNLTVWTPYEAGLGKTLAGSGERGRRLARMLQKEILAREACYFPQEHALYLPETSLNYLAADAALFLRDLGLPEKAPPAGPRERFYREVHRAAVAFLGSKIVNPKRKCTLPRDYERLLERKPGKRPSRPTLRRARLLVGYFRAEERAHARGVLPHSRRAVFHLSSRERCEIARRVGNVLGHQLMHLVWEGSIPREMLTDLVRFPLATRNAATRNHLALLDRIGPLARIAVGKHDSL